MGSGALAVLQPYCENDMQLLKRMSRSILTRLNVPLSGSDYDDFYSVANMTLWQANNSYDPNMGVSFEGFLYACLQKRFKSELTHRNRQKRILNQLAVSLDTVNEEGEECSRLDYLKSDFDTFEEATKEREDGSYHDKVSQYISKLSNQQINILNLLMDGFKPYEIRKILGISAKEYENDLKIMRCYDNVKVLF